MQVHVKTQKPHQGTFVQPSNTAIEDLTASQRKSYNNPVMQKSYLPSTNNRNDAADVVNSNAAFSLSEAIASEGLHNKEHAELHEGKNNLYNYQNARDLIVRFN